MPPVAFMELQSCTGLTKKGSLCHAAAAQQCIQLYLKRLSVGAAATPIPHSLAYASSQPGRQTCQQTQCHVELLQQGTHQPLGMYKISPGCRVTSQGWPVLLSPTRASTSSMSISDVLRRTMGELKGCTSLDCEGCTSWMRLAPNIWQKRLK